jgi:hypothetical protein
MKGLAIFHEYRKNFYRKRILKVTSVYEIITTIVAIFCSGPALLQQLLKSCLSFSPASSLP